MAQHEVLGPKTETGVKGKALYSATAVSSLLSMTALRNSSLELSSQWRRQDSKHWLPGPTAQTQRHSVGFLHYQTLNILRCSNFNFPAFFIHCTYKQPNHLPLVYRLKTLHALHSTCQNNFIHLFESKGFSRLNHQSSCPQDCWGRRVKCYI
uniref:Uncharacterized protein n=1 Tax=Corvus moneduloides TaxID=1196302 RepID=A0A8C3EUB9_CORMO